MKKSTLILVVIAAAVVGFVYWHEYVRAPKASNAKTNPVVFNFQPEDVATITLTHGGQPIVIERQGSSWQVVQPVQTRADKSAIESLLDDVTLARSSRTLTPTGGELKTYGLEPPDATLDFKLKNGQQHSLKVGTKDFSGDQAYAEADGSNQAILVPDSVREEAAKSLADLRDNSVLGITDADVNSFDLKTPSGEIEASRTGGSTTDWSIEKPEKLAGDSPAISQLLSNVSSGKIAKVVSENANDLAHYGLDHPAISFEAHLSSGDRTLSLGRKQGDQYFARDSSRDMVFLVPDSLQKQLDLTLFALRDKSLLHALPEDFTKVDYRAGSLEFSFGVDKSGKWVVFSPAAEKDKEVANWKVFDPLSSASATAILDSRSAAQMARVAKPAVEIVLTRKDGSTETFRFSAPVGDKVYAWVSDGKGLYELAKSSIDSLNFKSVSDILQ